MSSYPKKLDETSVNGSLESILSQFVSWWTESRFRDHEQRLEQIEGRVAQLATDPLAAVRLRSTLYTAQEAADELQVHVETLYQYLRLPESHTKRLPAILIGSQYRILPGDLADWLARNRNGVSDVAHDAAD